MEIPYDSSRETLEHIKEVSFYLGECIKNLVDRQDTHDSSKLKEPEKMYLDKFTPLLKKMAFGSEEYKETKLKMSVALNHHYANNKHHPENFINGINGMNLLDILEMFCDWMAATKRNPNGDIFRSIEIESREKGIDPQLVEILSNTAVWLLAVKEDKND